MSATVCVKSDQKRIVPGSYWYAYGSVAYDLSDSAEDLGCSFGSNPSLRLVNEDVAVSCTSKGTDVGGACVKMPMSRKRCRHTTGKGMAVAVATCAFLVLALLAVQVLLSAVGSSWESVAGDRGGITTVMVSVESGDTLWSMAEAHPIDGLTTQQCVKWIIDRNSLDSAILIPGQILELPRRTVS